MRKEPADVHSAEGDMVPQATDVYRVLADTLAREDVQDVLAAQCASDDHIGAMDEIQEGIMRMAHGGPPCSGGAAQHGFCGDTRDVAVWFLTCLIESLELPLETWFDAIALLDAYCLRTLTVIKVGDIPALCGALARMLLKVDSSEYMPYNDWRIFMRTVQLAWRLGPAGHPVTHPAVTQKCLKVQELAVLQALSWQINFPTVDVWLSAFCARMNTLARHGLISVLVPILTQSLNLSRIMLVHRAASPNFTPRRVAQGLLAIGCVAARLLPADSLGFEGYHGLEELFALPPQDGAGAAQTPFGFHVTSVLLQLATRSCLDALQEDSRAVALELRSAKSAIEEHSVITVPEATRNLWRNRRGASEVSRRCTTSI